MLSHLYNSLATSVCFDSLDDVVEMAPALSLMTALKEIYDFCL